MSDVLNSAMIDIFRLEAGSQLSVLQDSLDNLQTNDLQQEELECIVTTFAALKSAAKITGIPSIFELAKQVEDFFSQLTKEQAPLSAEHMAALAEVLGLLQDFIAAIDHDPQAWLTAQQGKLAALADRFNATPVSNSEVEKDPSETDEVTSQAPETSGSLGDLSMLELFRMEASGQGRILSDSLVALETNREDSQQLERLMRAAHSLKGAARMVGVDAAVRIAHLAEDIFVAAQEGRLTLTANDTDLLLRCVDMLLDIAQATSEDYNVWLTQHKAEIDELATALTDCLNGRTYRLPQLTSTKTAPTVSNPEQSVTDIDSSAQTDKAESTLQDENFVRVSGTSLNRLLGLAGEAQVASRWLEPFATSLLQVKKRQTELVTLLDQLREKLFDLKVDEHSHELIHSAHLKSNQCRDLLTERLSDLDAYDRRASSLAYRLNREILETRMRPFSEGVQGFQRLVRDISRSLDKDVKLDIRGLATRVDRDILDKLQAPLNHMIRNAIDHGIESREQRRQAGKAEQGSIRLEAMHSAGMLSIVIQDDGAGIDQDALREKIVKRGMVSKEMAANLSEAELFDFIFLPNFSTRESVTEISGRGVGLDVVQSVIQELHGQIRASSSLGQGVRFQIQLPLTLSVIRVLMVEVAKEIYAFPLARIDQTLKLNRDHIETMEGRQYFAYGERHIGLITAHQLLQCPTTQEATNEIPVVLLGDKTNQYGIVVDKFLGERNLVVHPIDPRLGKIQDISAASLTEDGTPLLIFDTDDLLRSIDILLAGGRISKLEQDQQSSAASSSKRVLVVDDSITVREVERNLLLAKGYEVEIAVDGVDGWNAARTKHYDLIVSDIDMPRMNGFELVGMLKNDQRLKDTPVIIVSYKDRDEDRQRGLEVGADYYLTKGSFHDDTLAEAVMDLIGPA